MDYTQRASTICKATSTELRMLVQTSTFRNADETGRTLLKKACSEIGIIKLAKDGDSR